MKSVANIFIGILVMLIFGSCQKSVYYFQAQPIDLKVINDSGIIYVKGSAVLQARDSFVWGASPIKINEKYYLFYSTWESGPEIPQFSGSWVLYSKIACAVSDSPEGNFHSLGIVLKGRNAAGDSTAWITSFLRTYLSLTFRSLLTMYEPLA